MKKAKVLEVKALVKETFPDFKEEANITPIAVRQYIRRRLPSDVLYETAVLIPSRSMAWVRIENLCNYLKVVRYWASL